MSRTFLGGVSFQRWQVFTVKVTLQARLWIEHTRSHSHCPTLWDAIAPDLLNRVALKEHDFLNFLQEEIERAKATYQNKSLLVECCGKSAHLVRGPRC